ncbi:MAG: carbohydrate kinase family protein [Clostridia bacterium]|nr:carbohydrate kinase family protein [Clostridia bacterium]
MSGKNGIAVCGTLLVDKINEIAAYPAAGELTKITGLKKAVGGCVPNVGIDLKRMCPSLTVYAVGNVGNDDEGTYVKDVLSKNGLELSGLKTVCGEKTSFTEVMSVKGGQRTFFTFAGADGGFCADDLDVEEISPKILHLGYFLLLQKIDEGEGLKILKKASEAGVQTSIDLVSENSDRYDLVVPCLESVDYLIINEIEAGKLTKMEPEKKNLISIAKKLLQMGVRKKVIIHMKDCAVCCSESGVSVAGAVDIPRKEIKGTTGAGDAFCAGALYAIYCGKSDSEILDFASCAAVMALRSADATSGLCSETEIIEYCKNIRRIEVCL